MTHATVVDKPAFRLPWHDGAKAYPEADTFAAAKEGLKRRRKSLIFHMTNTGEAGNSTCVVCARLLSEPAEGSTKIDPWSTWDYSPATKNVRNGRHYICSWGSLMNALLKIEA